MAGTEIIHNHKAANKSISFFRADIFSFPGNDDGCLQLKIQFLKMIRHAMNWSGSKNSVMVSEIKNRKGIENRCHLETTVSSGCFNMLPKSISISERGRTWHRSQ